MNNKQGCQQLHGKMKKTCFLFCAVIAFASWHKVNFKGYHKIQLSIVSKKNIVESYSSNEQTSRHGCE